MDKSRIEWTDATWNPVRGCMPVSEGCRNCYAARTARRFSYLGGAYEGLTKLSDDGPRWNGRIRTVPKLLDQPYRWKKPRRIFVDSMSDLFYGAVPAEYIGAVFDQMAAASWHTFIVATKRAERMHRLGSLGLYDPVLPNVQLLVSCEDQRRLDERLPYLLQTPAAVRGISLEPLLGPVDLHLFDCLLEDDHYETHERLDWVIVGGESGPRARPCDVEWIRSVVGQCTDAGVSVFVKQLGARPYEQHGEMDYCCEDCDKHPGKHPFEFEGSDGITRPLRHPKGGDINEWPEELRVREYP